MAYGRIEIVRNYLILGASSSVDGNSARPPLSEAKRLEELLQQHFAAMGRSSMGWNANHFSPQ